MPTFYSRSTTIQLSVANLATSITAEPQTISGPTTVRNSQSALTELGIASNDGTLSETPIYVEDTGSHVRCLGDHEDMPFFMVHAGKHFFSRTTTEKRTRRPAREYLQQEPSRSRKTNYLSIEFPSNPTSSYTIAESMGHESAASTENQEVNFSATVVATSPADPDMAFSNHSLHREPGDRNITPEADGSIENIGDHQTLPPNRSSLVRSQFIPQSLFKPDHPPPLVPHALCLTVFLSSASFLRTYDCHLKKSVLQDIKIDVYSNGELCASTYVPMRFRSDSSYNMTELTQRFSGRRIGRLMERPWVLVPPGQNSDGTLREHKRNKEAYVGAKQRWTAVSEALSIEAKRCGGSKCGGLSATGEYLASLAKLDMPAEVEEMQRAGGSKFGVLDVVVTAGRGQKDEPSQAQIPKPTPMRTGTDYRLNNHLELSKPRETYPAQLAVGKPESAPKRRTRKCADSHIAAQKFSYHTPRSNLSIPPVSDIQTTLSDEPKRSKSGDENILSVPITPSSAPSGAARCQSLALQDVESKLGHCGRPRRRPSLYSHSKGAPASSDAVTSVPENSITPANEQTPCFRSPQPIDMTPDLEGPRSKFRSRGMAISHDLDCDISILDKKEHFSEAEGDTSQLQLASETQHTSSPIFRMDFTDYARTPDLVQDTRSQTTRRTTAPPCSEPSSLDRRRRVSESTPVYPSTTPTNNENLNLLARWARTRTRTKNGTFQKSPPFPSSTIIPSKQHLGPESSTEAQQPPPKRPRPRIPFHIVYDNKMTLAEEIEAAMEEGAMTGKSTVSALIAPRRATRSSLTTSFKPPKPLTPTASSSQTPTTSPPGSDQAPITTTNPRLSKIVTLKLRPPKPPPLKPSSPTPFSEPQPPSEQPPTPSTPRSHLASPQLTQLSHPFHQTRADQTILPSRKRRRHRSTLAATGNNDLSWPTPSLSEDAAVTFAPKHMVRQVKGERSGRFEGTGVVMGVRFLVG
ncbi:hypothetical protein MMC12_001371 [Toensbergia leucococca]|nr:hypothetical protein [Toensbergia leucococca]